MTPLILFVAIAHQSVTHDLIYAKAGGVAFTMDEFKPATPNGMSILYMESGGWYSDHAFINPGVAKPFTDRGFTVFEVVHGSQPRYKIPEIEVMIGKAVRYVRANATQLGVAPNRIGIVGVSSGGHLSLMAGALGEPGKADAKDPVDRVSSRPDAIVAFCPPTDMVNFGSPGHMPTEDAKYKPFQGAFPLAPDATLDQRTAVAKSVSPIYYVNSNFPPTLLVHGDKDELVPLEQSQKLDEALAKANVPHEIVVVPGVGHGVGALPVGEQSFPTWLKNGGQAMFDWFQKYLK